MTFDDFRINIRKRFDDLSTQTHTETMDLLGRQFTISPQVFSPKLFSESLWFGEQLKDLTNDKTVLEIGTGTGIISLVCALNGADVEATDISKYALVNAEKNFTEYDVKIPLYGGDVYSAIPFEKKYDVIFWNHPFNFSTVADEKPLLKSIFDFGYNSLETYVAQAHSHLAPGGRLLLGSGNLADFGKITTLAHKYGYDLAELTCERCYIANDTFELYCSLYEFKKR